MISVIIREKSIELYIPMTPAEIEAVLQAAFNNCDLAGCPLTLTQQQILLQMVEELMLLDLGRGESTAIQLDNTNPLDELTPEQRQSFLQFVKSQEQQNRPWKIQLLNDWLQQNDSGSVQFIRDRFGTSWLHRLKPTHIAKYAEITGMEVLKLKVGDRIEVSNGLWEWVQEDGPCSREWFICTVIHVNEAGEGEQTYTNCIVRFNSGAEYEMQGMYEWNRYNWRWPQE